MLKSYVHSGGLSRVQDGDNCHSSVVDVSGMDVVCLIHHRHTKGMVIMAQKVSKETFEKMVDAVLEYNRTPRRELFEYPHNEWESRTLINNAEAVVRKVLALSEAS